MAPETQNKLRARLARIEGQIRGLARMIDEDRYCVDVVTQIQAVRAALIRVERIVLEDHLTRCVADAATSGDPAERRGKLRELLGLLDRTIRS